ncbi:MAG: hypothetical protein ACI9H6_000234 [Patiriisocius sp.]|jgi:hypothetical protein
MSDLSGAALQSSKKIMLNAAKANWLLGDVLEFVADRPLSNPHVQHLVAEMQQGRFLPAITTIIVCECNGQTYRLNGQHTATAVLQCAESDDGFALSGITLQTFSAESEGAMRQLYARIDRGAARTNTHVTHSILVGTADFDSFSKRVVKLLPMGLAFYLHENTNKRKLFGGESAALAVQSEYLALSKQVGSFMGGLNYRPSHHGHVFKSPVVAAMFATYAVDPEDAEVFWKAVATGVGFESEDEPASRLNRLLQTSTVGGGYQYRSVKTNIGAEEIFRACLHAWNRYRQGGHFSRTIHATALKSRPKVQ